MNDIEADRNIGRACSSHLTLTGKCNYFSFTPLTPIAENAYTETKCRFLSPVSSAQRSRKIKQPNKRSNCY